MLKIVKRDGHIVDYHPEKIKIAIQKANSEVRKDEMATPEQIDNIIQYIEDLNKKRILVEDIQDIIEEKLMEFGKYPLAKKYITYRYTRELVRKANTTDQSIKELVESGTGMPGNTEMEENIAGVIRQRNYLASVTSSDITKRFLLSEEIVKAHEEGIIHFHDMECFAQNAIHDSELINLEDMLQNGTVLNGIPIHKPRTIIEAAMQTLHIILEVSSSNYGSVTFSLAHLAPFVRESYQCYYKKYQKNGLPKEECQKLALQDRDNNVVEGIQILMHGLNAMTNIYGKKPNSYVFLYLNETEKYKEEEALLIQELLQQKITASQNGEGSYAIFPKIQYVLEEDNRKEKGKYWYLTKMIAEYVASGYEVQIISQKMREEEKQECYPCMGNGQFLTKDRLGRFENIAKSQDAKENGGKYYGRFQQGMVTLNLLDVAISSEKNRDIFWNTLQERLVLCHKALQIRHKRLSNVRSDMAPIIWQYGAIARLEKGVSIHELLHHGYSILSLGYVGFYECIQYMTDQSYLEEGEGQQFGIEVMKQLRDTLMKWVAEEDIDYTLYEVESECITRRLVQCMQQKYGVIKEITDKDTISNFAPHMNDDEVFIDLQKEENFAKQCPCMGRKYYRISSLGTTRKEVEGWLSQIYEMIPYVKIG